MSKAPDRSIFYVQERKLDDELKAEIISDQEKKRCTALQNLRNL